MLVGGSDLDYATSQVAPLGLHPISFAGKAMTCLGFVDYIDSTGGSYKEFYVSYFVTDSPIEGNVCCL